MRRKSGYLFEKHGEEDGQPEHSKTAREHLDAEGSGAPAQLGQRGEPCFDEKSLSAFFQIEKTTHDEDLNRKERLSETHLQRPRR